jgi:hypothetical protein
MNETPVIRWVDYSKKTTEIRSDYQKEIGPASSRTCTWSKDWKRILAEKKPANTTGMFAGILIGGAG